MKIREYISQKLRAWNITDAQLEDISSGIDLDEEYTSDNSQVVGKAMISVIEELMEPAGRLLRRVRLSLHFCRKRSICFL